MYNIHFNTEPESPAHIQNSHRMPLLGQQITTKIKALFYEHCYCLYIRQEDEYNRKNALMLSRNKAQLESHICVT